MGPGRLLIIYLGAVFVGGALAAPWLYHLVQWASQQWPALEGLASNPFSRFLNRSLLIMALLGLWPLLKGLGIRSWTGVGLGKDPLAGKHLAIGLAAGFVSLAVLAGLTLAAGASVMDPRRSAWDLCRHALNAGLAATVVSVLEEVLFRGILFGSLRRAHAWPLALMMSSALYAFVHFFERAPQLDTVEWSSGLLALAAMLRGFGDLEMFVPGFLNLMLAGVILGLSYQRLGRLYFPIGLHAGWIFWLKSNRFMTEESPGANLWFWGTGKLIDGWLALVVLGLLAAAFLMWFRQGPVDSASPQNRMAVDDQTANEG